MKKNGEKPEDKKGERVMDERRAEAAAVQKNMARLPSTQAAFAR